MREIIIRAPNSGLFRRQGAETEATINSEEANHDVETRLHLSTKHILVVHFLKCPEIRIAHCLDC